MSKLLIVVDAQNDFITGSLRNSKAIEAMPRIKEKIMKEAAAGTKILYTKDTHFENYLETDEGKMLPIPHCIRYSWGWDIPEDIYVEGSPVYQKFTFGGYHLPDFITDHDLLVDKDNNRINEIELIGFCTNICVVSNALILKAAYPHVNIKISVDANCCAGTTVEAHNAALEVMRSCQIEIKE